MSTYKSLKEIAQDIRTKLKAELPNCKFSVSTDYYSMGQALYVRLMSAPFVVFAKATDINGYVRTKEYTQLNQYVLLDSRPNDERICNGHFLTEQGWNAVKRMTEIANAENWDRSDSMQDIYNVNYSLHVGIGKWNKPCTITGAAKPVHAAA